MKMICDPEETSILNSFMIAPPKAACHPNPCLNGGMCKETGVNQDFECICPNPRFKGRFCDGE